MTCQLTPEQLNSRDARGLHARRRPPDMVGQGLEVLHDGGEMELVACAGKASQAHPLEAMMGLQVRKAHLDPLSLIARLVVLRRPHERARLIPGIFVHVAGDFPRGHRSDSTAA